MGNNQINIPFCYKDSTFFQSTAEICLTCPFFLACSAHVGGAPTVKIRKQDFLKELLIQEVPPLFIDLAYMALYGVSHNSAKCARKYHARKHRESLK